MKLALFLNQGIELLEIIGDLPLVQFTTRTNHYNEPIRNTEQQSGHIYYTLFLLLVHSAVLPFTSRSKRVQLWFLQAAATCAINCAEPKPFS
jgi:hypothetical protein